MANGFAIGVAEGLPSGLQAGSRISGRIEESRQNKQQVERQGRLDRRRELAGNLAASDAYLNNPRIGDEAKKDYYNNIYIPIMEELLGKGVKVPTITAWTPGLGKYVKQSLGIVEDVGKGKLTRKQGKLAFAAMPDEARTDFRIKTITEDFYEEGRRRKTDQFEADKVFMRNQPGRTGTPSPEESQRFNRIRSTPGYAEELGNAIMAESGQVQKPFGSRGAAIGGFITEQQKKGVPLGQAITEAGKFGTGKTPSKIDLAIKAANVPANLNEMTPEDAISVLTKLKEFSASNSDFDAFFELMKQNKDQGFFGKVFGGLFGKGQEQVTPTNEFSSQDQEALNNVLGQSGPVQ